MHTSETTGKAVEAKLTRSNGEIKRPELECITRKSDRKREGKKEEEDKKKEKDAFRKQTLSVL